MFNDSNHVKQLVSFDDVSVTSLNNEVLSESIIKQVTFNDRLTFRCEWRIEANRVANLGVNTWTCSLHVGQPNQQVTEMVHIIDVHDCSSPSEYRVNIDTLRQWQDELDSPFDNLTEQDFSWLLTDVQKHLSNHAHQ